MSARLYGTFVLVILSSTGNSQAQNQSSKSTLEPLPPAVISQPERIAVDRLEIVQIREMIDAGLDEQIVTPMVRERGIARPLMVDDLVSLRRAGASNELILEIQKSAPKATVYSPGQPAVVHVYEPSPPPVIVRTVPSYYPSYYLGPVPHVYMRPSYHHHPHYSHPRSGGRVSFGFSF
ncbi:MAG: hypothetical protein ACYC6N_20040 [Pirellulaceae bacterium]